MVLDLVVAFFTTPILLLAAYGAYSLFTNRAALKVRLYAEARLLESQAKSVETQLLRNAELYLAQKEQQAKAMLAQEVKKAEGVAQTAEVAAKGLAKTVEADVKEEVTDVKDAVEKEVKKL